MSLPHTPDIDVECLACMSDVPTSKTALLPCDHRMCNDCLTRLFNLSLTDPQHMPPKCCTTRPIPLKHVDKLFDHKFKRKWNAKSLEFSTKNRIYCPSKRCGTWIKPTEMKNDPSGRKYGKCSRCRLKVCCACNGKWHTSKKCPDDAETKEFVKFAREHGWQRCYNCAATVELKEGCNHMTCRCKAEFCMICAAKWKTCDCPWFNYQTVEADRLRHMNVPPAQRPNPLRYQEEMDLRREQLRHDEDLARRFQMLAFQDHAFGPQGVALPHGPPPMLDDMFVRRARELLAGQADQWNNAAAERLLYNEIRRQAFWPRQPDDVQRPPRHNEPPPNQPPPAAPAPPRATATPLRRANTTGNEQTIPRRPPEQDYHVDAERHRPVPNVNAINNARARASQLAGMAQNRSGAARVDAWRRRVDPSFNHE